MPQVGWYPSTRQKTLFVPVTLRIRCVLCQLHVKLQHAGGARWHGVTVKTERLHVWPRAVRFHSQI